VKRKTLAVVSLILVLGLYAGLHGQQVINGFRYLVNVTAASVTTPPSGQTAVYVDSSSKKLCTKDDGALTTCMASIPGYKIYGPNITPVTVSNTVAETNLQTVSISANDLDQGQVVEVIARGAMTTAATAPGNVQFRWYVNGASVAGSAVNGLAVNKGNIAWEARLYLYAIDPVGSAATVGTNGMFFNPIASTGTAVVVNGTDGLSTLATNAQMDVKLTVNFSTATAGNICVSRLMYGERKN
jgi:LEA14-like dessication related protein